MRSIFDPLARAELQARLRELRPDARPRWGKMSAPEMLCHLADQMRVSLGDVPSRARWTPFRLWPVRMLVIHLLPWPKGAPTAPEMQATRPGSWEADVASVSALIDRFAGAERKTDWPVHPAFGRLPTREWGWLVYKHNDHHFRQFGV